MGRRNGQGERLKKSYHDHITYICTNVVDEWDYAAQKLIRSFRMPANSGPVSCVASMPNGKHIIW